MPEHVTPEFGGTEKGRSMISAYRSLAVKSSNSKFEKLSMALIIRPAVQATEAGWQTRRACGHVDEGTCPHQVLAATLTLSQPGGADQAHPILVSTPSFESQRRACRLPGVYGCRICNVECIICGCNYYDKLVWLYFLRLIYLQCQ